jgi:hypothetical protein
VNKIDIHDYFSAPTKGARQWGLMFLCSFITAHNSSVPSAGVMRGGVGRGPLGKQAPCRGDSSGKQRARTQETVSHIKNVTS